MLVLANGGKQNLSLAQAKAGIYVGAGVYCTRLELPDVVAYTVYQHIAFRGWGNSSYFLIETPATTFGRARPLSKK